MILTEEAEKVVHINGGEAFIWLVILFIVIACALNGADAAEDRNGVAVAWWGLMFLIAFSVGVLYTVALIQT